MLNPYTIILYLFTAAGLFATFWGWIIIRKARITLTWPHAPGVIIESLPYSENDAHIPHITYQYTVNDNPIIKPFTIPSGVTPSEEYAKNYARKYPAGTHVQVYFDPDDPHQTTLEPGLRNGDWFIFALGIGSALFGIGMLIFGEAQ